MRIRIRRGFFIGLAIAIALALPLPWLAEYWIAASLDFQAARKGFAEAIEERTGLNVSVQGVQFDIFRGIVFNGAKFYYEKSDGVRVHLVQAESAALSFSAFAWLTGDPPVRSMVLRGARWVGGDGRGAGPEDNPSEEPEESVRSAVFERISASVPGAAGAESSQASALVAPDLTLIAEDLRIHLSDPGLPLRDQGAADRFSLDLFVEPRPNEGRYDIEFEVRALRSGRVIGRVRGEGDWRGGNRGRLFFNVDRAPVRLIGAALADTPLAPLDFVDPESGVFAGDGWISGEGSFDSYGAGAGFNASGRYEDLGLELGESGFRMLELREGAGRFRFNAGFRQENPEHYYLALELRQPELEFELRSQNLPVYHSANDSEASADSTAQREAAEAAREAIEGRFGSGESLDFFQADGAGGAFLHARGRLELAVAQDRGEGSAGQVGPRLAGASGGRIRFEYLGAADPADSRGRRARSTALAPRFRIDLEETALAAPAGLLDFSADGGAPFASEAGLAGADATETAAQSDNPSEKNLGLLIIREGRISNEAAPGEGLRINLRGDALDGSFVVNGGGRFAVDLPQESPYAGPDAPPFTLDLDADLRARFEGLSWLRLAATARNAFRLINYAGSREDSRKAEDLGPLWQNKFMDTGLYRQYIQRLRLQLEAQLEDLQPAGLPNRIALRGRMRDGSLLLESEPYRDERTEFRMRYSGNFQNFIPFHSLDLRARADGPLPPAPALTGVSTSPRDFEIDYSFNGEGVFAGDLVQRSYSRLEIRCGRLELGAPRLLEILRHDAGLDFRNRTPPALPLEDFRSVRVTDGPRVQLTIRARGPGFDASGGGESVIGLGGELDLRYVRLDDEGLAADRDVLRLRISPAGALEPRI